MKTWLPFKKVLRTKEYPFGWVTDTLILCKNDLARDRAIKALKLKARYCLWYNPLVGHRFDHIIVIPDFAHAMSESDRRVFAQICEDVKLKLTPGGEFTIL
jgi:hypothetical protein